MNELDDIQRKIFEKLAELEKLEKQKLAAQKRKEKYIGNWWEAYYHITHETWAVRLKPSIGEIWIGLFDNRSVAIEMVDELDKSIIWVKEESKKR